MAATLLHYSIVFIRNKCVDNYSQILLMFSIKQSRFTVSSSYINKMYLVSFNLTLVIKGIKLRTFKKWNRINKLKSYFFVRNMLFKIEDESYEGNEAVDKSKGNVSKAEDTIEAAQKEISVSKTYYYIMLTSNFVT